MQDEIVLVCRAPNLPAKTRVIEKSVQPEVLTTKTKLGFCMRLPVELLSKAQAQCPKNSEQVTSIRSRIVSSSASVLDGLNYVERRRAMIAALASQRKRKPCFRTLAWRQRPPAD